MNQICNHAHNPVIPVHGETDCQCMCDEFATKEVTYTRTSFGQVKTFRELMCDACFSDPDNFEGKTIVSITDFEQDEVPHKIFTPGRVADMFLAECKNQL